MLFNRAEIKENAKAAFKANYWPMVGFTLVGAIIIVFSSIVPVCLLTYPISAGFGYFMYKVYKGDDVDFENMFAAFKNNLFGHVFGGMWYLTLFILLWIAIPFILYYVGIIGAVLGSPACIVLAVVGYISILVISVYKGIQYSMVPYILIDMPEIKATEAIKKSIEMTNGYKKDIFVFELSFIGWDLLGIITCGLVSIFYVSPYKNVAVAGLYDFLKRANGLEQVAPEAPVFEKVEE